MKLSIWLDVKKENNKFCISGRRNYLRLILPLIFVLQQNNKLLSPRRKSDPQEFQTTFWSFYFLNLILFTHRSELACIFFFFFLINQWLTSDSPWLIVINLRLKTGQSEYIPSRIIYSLGCKCSAFFLHCEPHNQFVPTGKCFVQKCRYLEIQLMRAKNINWITGKW